MSYLNPIGEAVRFGLSYEKMRLEAASYNLAIANVAIQNNQNSSGLSVSVSASPFANAMGLPTLVKQTENPDTFRKVHDPHNPNANADGDVLYPNIDPTHEMTTLVSATRAYEANVRAFNTIHQMSSKALEIGGRR